MNRVSIDRIHLQVILKASPVSYDLFLCFVHHLALAPSRPAARRALVSAGASPAECRRPACVEALPVWRPCLGSCAADVSHPEQSGEALTSSAGGGRVRGIEGGSSGWGGYYISNDAIFA